MSRKKRWTEKKIQRILAFYYAIDKNHLFSIPNSSIFGWEMDLLSVTNSLFCHEVEIKISRSDFRADHKKRKHKIIQNSLRWKMQHRLYIPNYFWYATPKDICCCEEVPQYAGLMRINNSNEPVKILKKAPRLCKRKLSDKEILKIAHLLSFRFWFRKAKITVKNHEYR